MIVPIEGFMESSKLKGHYQEAVKEEEGEE
jgi:hypothetical protein